MCSPLTVGGCDSVVTVVCHDACDAGRLCVWPGAVVPPCIRIDPDSFPRQVRRPNLASVLCSVQFLKYHAKLLAGKVVSDIIYFCVV